MTRPPRAGSHSAVSLCGLPVRIENVRLLAGKLEGDRLAEKLERAVANGNTIVALSLEDRQRIVDVLGRAPSSLPDLRIALDAQLRRHKEREGKMERAGRDREIIERRRAAAAQAPSIGGR